jgi:cytochrome c-type biogenesis protein CcmE
MFYVVLIHLGDSPGSEFMCRHFGTLCSIFIVGVRKKIGYFEMSAHKIQSRRFGTLCSIFIVGVRKKIGYFVTSAHKIQTLGNHPKERIQHSEHGESLK